MDYNINVARRRLPGAASGPDPTRRRGGLTSAEKEGGAISSKVFVGNLSFDTTRDELQTLFAEVGEIVQVVVPTDRSTGQQRGFAFVEFSSAEHAAQAIQKFEGFELGGRRLRVNEATSERPAGGRPMGGGGQDRPTFRPRPKGSRRNVRARKRSIW